jgi:uncharacterized protein YecE (DUF72 family)
LPLQKLPESDNARIWRIGTSGWSYPPRSGSGSWTGLFYPLKKVDELEFYSRYFDTVEVNSTFYRPCSPKTAESWVARTPVEFEFTIKAWQQFTHNREAILPEDLATFKEGIAPIAAAGRLGCILFQFPTSFHCDDGTRDRLRALLDQFADYPKAVELRHRSWDDLADVLDDSDAVRAFIDEPKFRDSTRQKLTSHGGMLYVRFHGRQAQKWWHHEHRNERYDYLYSREEIRTHASSLRSVVTAQPIQKAYTFFNNHPNAKAVVNAVMLRAELGIPVSDRLPDTLVNAYPSLKEG